MDHLLIRAIIAKAVRFPERGVLIINRVRWAVAVDDEGVPIETAALRAALVAAISEAK
jgi:hypothetical protein